MRALIHTAGSIWIPILGALVVVLICAPIFTLGLCIKQIGVMTMWVSRWLEDLMEWAVSPWL